MSSQPRPYIYLGPPRKPEEWLGYYHLRWKELREPLGKPPGSERDELEAQALHACMVDAQGAVIGVMRLHERTAGLGQFRFLAVAPEHRRKGLARAFFQYLETLARQRGLEAIMFNARTQWVELYQKFGYTPQGEVFESVGIPHQEMRKQL